MRPLFQTKPGATFYGDSKISMVMRKDYIEYVLNLGNSIYAVVNLMIFRDQLVFVINCDSFFKNVEALLSYLSLHEEELPTLFSLINGKNKEYEIGLFSPSRNIKGKSLGILRLVARPGVDTETEITVASHHEVINYALSTILFAQTIFKEISGSEDSTISNLQYSFFNT